MKGAVFFLIEYLSKKIQTIQNNSKQFKKKKTIRAT